MRVHRILATSIGSPVGGAAMLDAMKVKGMIDHIEYNDAMKEIPKHGSTALRAFSVLDYVVKASGPVSLDEATRGCNLPKPTVFRILDMLQEADLLQREPISKRYTIGPRLASFGLDVLQHSVLRTKYDGILRELVAETGETCNLTTLDGAEVLYLHRVETSLPLRLSLGPGTRVPLHCTASGKLFLSQLPPRQVSRLLGTLPLKRYTDKTITDRKILDQALKGIRASQLGTYDSEYFSDSVAIAVPVGDQNGLAVAIHAPSSRLTIDGCMKHLPALRRAAEAIASVLLPKSVSSDEASARKPATRAKSQCK
jgi:DNA-binding IclR family transcriptional regulator